MVEITNTSSQLGEILGILNNLGFFNVILPMVLIYALVLGVLEKTSIFTTKSSGEEKSNKNVNAAIAFSLALISVASANVVGIISGISTYFVVGLFVIFYFMVLLATVDLGDKSYLNLVLENSAFRWILISSLLIIGATILFSVVKVGERTLFNIIYNNLKGYFPILVVALLSIIFYFLFVRDKSKG